MSGVSARPKQLDIAAYWNNQEMKARQAGHTEAASEFRERITAYTAGLPSGPPPSKDSVGSTAAP
ncbi:hypothetical protein, partial [Lysinibacillus sp. GbtcB16]|uniref:hypothetical protein n=1 Tax=Lysinibacillus sp. GbtcB16 TaxID=2824761 RepID=UPI001C304437